ncbi:hypothetical protein DESPIG_00418 [Desulfovibrio piger ATCC 29098]|uniref:Uncharacterized protein n=1 Tax=Desulfovibrio piger ATCC 29098 TaxID=411464 RepID=B6WQT8_9BACT|nr:hypothetical protein DESPIG_00418 [Desulfovibrio piger ATCC 29098]
MVISYRCGLMPGYRLFPSSLRRAKQAAVVMERGSLSPAHPFRAA